MIFNHYHAQKGGYMKSYNILCIILLCLLSLVNLNVNAKTSRKNTIKKVFTLFSKDLTDKQPLPDFCTRQKGNQSPHLAWDYAPEKAASFAIINHDPEGGPWSHWIIFNIPPTIKELARGVPHGIATLENKMLQGMNSYSQIGYDGAWPPVGSGLHHYIFTIYALDTILNLPAGKATMETLLDAMHGHILAKASITTTYSRS
jgi:Raf kinase inhibitor-like YbhB/YbcL family protein